MLLSKVVAAYHEADMDQTNICYGQNAKILNFEHGH